jgi:diacylglycerol kinase (ATP)
MQETSDSPLSPAASIPRRIGVLLNPCSGYAQRHLNALRHVAARLPDCVVVEGSTPVQMTQAVKSFLLQSDDLLVVIGGDGTLQAALTALMRLQPNQLPQVLVVAAGTTNMSANDLGARLKPVAALQALSDWCTHQALAPQASPRAVLRVCDSGAGQAQFGLFLGAGAIISGVRYFHATVRPKGVRGALGPSMALVRVLLSLMRNRPHPLLPATQALLHLPQRSVDGQWLVILATTLHTLMMGSTPYWGSEKAPIHVTALAHRPARLLRTLPCLWRGKINPTMRSDQGYSSHNLTQTSIDDLSEYLLDGEIFPVSGKLQIGATTPVRFIAF